MSSFDCSGEWKAHKAGESGHFTCHNCGEAVSGTELNEVAHAQLCDGCYDEHMIELAAQEEAEQATADMLSEEYTESRTHRVTKPNPRE